MAAAVVAAVLIWEEADRGAVPTHSAAKPYNSGASRSCRRKRVSLCSVSLTLVSYAESRLTGCSHDAALSPDVTRQPACTFWGAPVERRCCREQEGPGSGVRISGKSLNRWSLYSLTHETATTVASP